MKFLVFPTLFLNFWQSLNDYSQHLFLCNFNIYEIFTFSILVGMFGILVHTYKYQNLYKCDKFDSTIFQSKTSTNFNVRFFWKPKKKIQWSHQMMSANKITHLFIKANSNYISLVYRNHLYLQNVFHYIWCVYLHTNTFHLIWKLNIAANARK